MEEVLNKKELVQTMDDRELSLISALRDNARSSLMRISKISGIPISTVYDKIKRFEKSCIRKHTTLVDFQKLGFPIRIHMMAKVRDHDAFRNFVESHESVNSVFVIDGEYQYSLDCIFREIQSMKRFLEQIKGVEKKMVHFVLDEVKQEAFLNSRS